MGHHGAICQSPRFWTNVWHEAAPMGHCGVTSVSGGDGELFKSEQGSNPPVWVNQYLRHYFVFG
jgi:hypothetical protein